MKIKVLRNLGARFPDYKEGQVVEVKKADGELLVEQGLAEPADMSDSASEKTDPETTIEAVPKNHRRASKEDK